MSQTPLLSVCLITYNHANYIRQALDSILMQRVNFSWELIVADDYSTDGTRKIIESYISEHRNFIRPIFQHQNVGAFRNWHDLLSASSSKYIAYIEGDDYWIDSLKLQKQVDFFESNPDYSIVISNAITVDETGKPLQSISNKQSKFELLDLLGIKAIDIASSSVVYRSECLKNNFLKSIESLPYGDWPLYLNCLRYGKGHVLSDPTTAYRIHQRGAWSSQNKITQFIKFMEMFDYFLVTFPEYGNYILEQRKTYIQNELNSLQQTHKNRKFSIINSIKIVREKILRALKF